MVKEDLTPRKIMTREALRNAIRVSMAMGASTNSTLHLPAIAHEAGIHITLDDFDELSREIPYLCNIKPSGQYPLSVLEEQGGVPAVMKALERKLDLEQMTVSGRRWAKISPGLSWWKTMSSSPWTPQEARGRPGYSSRQSGPQGRSGETGGGQAQHALL